jgi:peroxiredoxin Q/BCP
MIEPGTLAPDFTARTTRGEWLRLHDRAGRWIVLYFFPKAFTGG